MSSIKVRSDRPNTATFVPNFFIDKYMLEANGEYVKIYLYLLRCMGSSDYEFSISQAADLFEHTEGDITRALRYWEKMNLLHLEYNERQELTGICLLQPVPSPEPVTAAGTPAKADQPEETRSYTRDETDQFKKQEDIQELLFITEKYLKRTLTATDLQIIQYWFDGLHFSNDLVEYLIEYCVNGNHLSLRYMEKVALAWAEQGIRTVEEAKSASAGYSKLHFAVKKALGIKNRELVPGEIAFIDKWSKEYHFSQELICEACGRTIQATHQSSFEYTDKILQNWLKKEVHTLEDIARVDSAYQNQKKYSPSNANPAGNNYRSRPNNNFNNFPQRNYDYSKLEKQLLNRKSDS